MCQNEYLWNKELTVGNTVGEGENACYQHFVLFPPCFPKPSP